MNWGIISCANIAVNSVIPAILRASDNNSITVSSRNISKAKEVADKFQCKYAETYDAILNDESIEAVYIPLPTGLHYEWIMKAIKNRKHVLVEKSAVMTFSEAENVVKCAKENNIAVVENFQFQHHSQHQFVFDLLKNDEIGAIRAFRAYFGFPPFPEKTNIRYNKDLGGGALLDAGAYTLKATTFMMGDSFQVKSSFLKENDQFNVDWFGGAFLAHKEKGIFSEVSFGFDNFYQCGYEIWGSKGKLTTTRAYTAKKDFKPTIIIEKQGDKKEIQLKEDDHFKNMINHFTTIVKEDNFEKEWNNILVQAKLIEEVRNNNEVRS